MYENNRDLLSLCYDGLDEIRDGFYIVKENGRCGVIDAGGKVILPIDYKDILAIGDKLYANRSGISYVEYSSKNFEKVENGAKYSRIDKFTDHAYIVSSKDDSLCGILNDQGRIVMPERYTSIYLYKSDSTHDYIKAKLAMEGTYDMGYSELGLVKIDKEYNSPDCLMAFETPLDNLQIVVSSISGRGSYIHNRRQCRFKLRYNGKIVGEQYNDIQFREHLRGYGMVQTYNYLDKLVTTGLETYEGKEIVDAYSYRDVQYIGNNIVIIKDCRGYGTFVIGEGVVVEPTYKDLCLLGSIPITVLHNNGENQMFVGNDGNIYSEVIKAFPVYKSTIDPRVNMMNLYGNWIYVKDNLERIYDVDQRLKNKYKWNKVE